MFRKQPVNKPKAVMIRKRNGSVEYPEHNLFFYPNENETAEEKAIKWFCKYRGEIISLIIEDE